MLLVANIFPVIGMEFQGLRVETTVLGAAWQLWRMEMPLVSVLVVLTIVLVPALEQWLRERGAGTLDDLARPTALARPPAKAR